MALHHVRALHHVITSVICLKVPRDQYIINKTHEVKTYDNSKIWSTFLDLLPTALSLLKIVFWYRFRSKPFEFKNLIHWHSKFKSKIQYTLL